jgi:hypothetical protein
MKSKDSEVVTPFSLDFILHLTEVSLGCGWRKWPPNMEGSCSCGLMERSGAPAWELDVGLTTHHKKLACYVMLHRALDLDGFFEAT